MYGQCLITPTILDSYEFAKSAPNSWKVRAETGFLQKLRREKAEYPAWVGKGLDFEDTVYRVCGVHDKAAPKGSKLFQEVVAKCHGGKFQEKLSKKVAIAGQKVFLFGYCDVTFPILTIDLKTTLNYKGPLKYLNGHQHLIYSYIRQVPDFKYLIAQWSSETADTIQAVHEVDYTVPDFKELEKDIFERIEAFFDYLRAENLWLDYYHTFSNNK